MSTEADESSGYGHVHRAFLQAFIGRSTITFDDAQPILAAILTADEPGRTTLAGDISEADFHMYISTINASISAFDLEIRNMFTQTTGAGRKRVYALVNTTSDAISQLATTHSADEIAYVKRLLDEMFDKNNTPTREVLAVKDMTAINLRTVTRRSSGANGTETQGNAASAQSLTGAQAEKLLKTLVAEGWFEKSGHYYMLGPRALMELKNWLLETYNEVEYDEDDDEPEQVVERVKQCYGCKEIVTIGQRCSDRLCKCRMHDFCAQSVFRNTRDYKCPLCRAEWTGNDFVGIRALNTANARDRQSNASTNGTREAREPESRRVSEIRRESGRRSSATSSRRSSTQADEDANMDEDE